MVQGKWNITIKTPMGDKSGVLELKAEGTALTGSLSYALIAGLERRVTFWHASYREKEA